MWPSLGFTSFVLDCLLQQTYKMKLASLLAAAILLVSSDKLTAQQKRASFFTWRKSGALPSAAANQHSHGVGGAIAGIHANKLIILGGTYFPEKMPWQGGKKKYETKGFVFAINDTGAFSLEHEFQFPVPIGYAAVCETSEGLLVAGGENQEGLSNKVWILKYHAAEKKVIITSLPALPYSVSSASACSIHDKIFLAGGETETSASNGLLQFDLRASSLVWKQMASIPVAVSHSVLLASSTSAQNHLLLIGGRKKSAGQLTVFYQSVYKYDLNADRWIEGPALPYPLAAGTGVMNRKGTCFLFGGDQGETFHKVEELILKMEDTKDNAQRELLNQEKIRVQSSHPGFSKEILLLEENAKSWKRADAFPYPVPVTTRAIGWADKVIMAPGEIKAGIRSADIILGTPIQQLP